MQITKQLLQYLDVKSFIISIDNENYMVFPIEYHDFTFSLSVSSKIKNLFRNKKIDLQISFFEKQTIEFVANLESFSDDTLTIFVEKDNSSLEAKDFLEKIELFDYQDDFYSKRRSENRFPIGKEHYKDFGLSSVEQAIFIPQMKFVQPCAIVDVSFHGLQIITPYDNQTIKKENLFFVKLDFVPKELVVVKIHKVNARLNNIGEKTYANISCQLLEPINFSWKRRIIQMLKNTNVYDNI